MGIAKTPDGRLYRFLRWRERIIPESAFIGILAFIIGILCSVASALLKSTIHIIQRYATGIQVGKDLYFNYLILPVVGVLLSGLFVKYLLKEDISHGVTKILYSISQRKSRLKPHNMWSSIVASAITIGMGGSVGAESPIVLTGSAIGSNVGRYFHLEHRNLMLLLGCGAAGAVSGIFKAPITGLIFVIEVLMMDLTLTSVLPLLISSVTAATLSYVFFGSEAMFSYEATELFTIQRVPWVIVLGILSGLASLYFTKISFALEQRIKRGDSYWKRFMVSALILSTLIFLFPPLYGEGYVTISDLIKGNGGSVMQGSLFELMDNNVWLLPVFLFLTMTTKVFATVATNAGGGCGGVFAPSLFIGALVGFVFSYVMNLLGVIGHLPTDNFALMGMAGVMAGVMHAPLTGTFLIAELTGGYNLFLPLLIVSISSFATIKLFLPHSIYSMRLAEKGKLVTHHKDKAVLTLMELSHVIENDFSILHPKMTLGDTVRIFGQSNRNIFPVLDDKDRMVGMVLLDNIRNIMFRPELYERFKVETFMVSAEARVNTSMSMDDVMKIFDDTRAWNLPVEDDNGKYLGFVSKSQIFNQYREVLNENFGGE
ncbi:chloride channel protein [Porphyromonadaceae bacterium W3.11]|nr:chloride channel protein [Porphyromonadaceae bacterium W3.11]